MEFRYEERVINSHTDMEKLETEKVKDFAEIDGWHEVYRRNTTNCNSVADLHEEINSGLYQPCIECNIMSMEHEVKLPINIFISVEDSTSEKTIELRQAFHSN